MAEAERKCPAAVTKEEITGREWRQERAGSARMSHCWCSVCSERVSND